MPERLAVTDAPEPRALVGLIMGSRSDWETMRHAAAVLDELAVPHEAAVVSAHRTPARLYEYATAAEARGLRVLIAGAGGAAHLPGMAAAMTPLPVFGVPVESHALKGMDSLLSIVQMPAGVPVGTLAIGRAGAVNAALLAAAVLALSDKALAARLAAWRRAQTESVPAKHGPRPAGPGVTAPLQPGATIGILGGGQLGRMSAMAAARLGYRCHVFAPDTDSPGMQIAAAATVASYDDEAALQRFAAAVDVVTFEFENVPAATLEALAPLAPCRPGVEVLRVCQDRIAEKEFLERAGVPVAPWRPVRSPDEIKAAIADIGLPAVLKTTRMGYDGRGQAVLRTAGDVEAAYASLEPKPLVLEAFVPFQMEVSAIAARGADGGTAVFDAVENRHRNHILDLSLAPARVPDAVAAVARGHAVRVAEELALVGVLALEMFLLPDGTLLGNEIAPRPHNSGHWTIDACLASQFEQHVRAVAGLPLADPARHHDAVMRNLVGPEGLAAWPRVVGDGRLAAHLYGKAEARQGRKLGHATRLLPIGRLADLAETDITTGL